MDKVNAYKYTMQHTLYKDSDKLLQKVSLTQMKSDTHVYVFSIVDVFIILLNTFFVTYFHITTIVLRL